MITQEDIFISAQLLIDRYGDQAGDYTMQKMMELIANDDPKGASVWFDIGSAINDLRRIISSGQLH